MMDMMGAKVLLARHGETGWNRQGRRQGQLDSPLTVVGRRQADQLASLATALEVDAVFSSPMGRAVETARPVAAARGVRIVVLEDLAEMDHGTMAGFTTEEIEASFPGALSRRGQEKWSWAFPGGESYADVDRRAGRPLGTIAASGATRPMVMSHEMVGRLLVRQLLGWGRARASNGAIPTRRCSTSILPLATSATSSSRPVAPESRPPRPFRG